MIISILVILTVLALVFVRLNGGKLFKKAARETYEIGEEMDDLKKEMIDEEKKLKKNIGKLKKKYAK
jgi:hypothetical protein